VSPARPIVVFERTGTGAHTARRAAAPPEGAVRIRSGRGVPAPARRARRPRRVRTLLGDFLWLATIVVLLVATWPASLGGWTSYVIVHGLSMEPTYSSGDLVIVREESHYHVGDIVAYTIPKPSPIAGHVVIHRVKEITPRGIITEGDNRETEDEWYLHHDDILGTARIHLGVPGGESFWGYVPWGFCFLIGVGVVWMLWPGRPTTEEVEDERALRAERARAARHKHSRRRRREIRSARAEIAQMVTGAVALVGAIVILIVTLA
jgi:signal peptidase